MQTLRDRTARETPACIAIGAHVMAGALTALMSDVAEPRKRLKQLRDRKIWMELVPGPFMDWLETEIIGADAREYFVRDDAEHQLKQGWHTAMITG